MADLYFNRFDLDIDCEAIDKDFILLSFRQKSDWLSYDKVAFLDELIATPQCNALATCFLGGVAYALYDRREFQGPPKAIIDQLVLEDDIIAEAVRPEKIHVHKLFQLFLNACASSQNPRYRFNNLTGKLFITSPDKTFFNKADASRIALEVKVKWGNEVDLATVTFTSLARYQDLVKNKFGGEDPGRKKKLLDKERYFFDPRNSTFRRAFEQDRQKAGDLFVIMRPLEKFIKGKKKNSIDFLSLNPKKYPFTKIALFNDLLFSTFQTRFGAYFKLEQPVVRLGVESKNFKPAVSTFDALQNAPIRLIDKVGDEGLLWQIKTMMKKEFGLTPPLGKKIKAGWINLHFIHDPGYYHANGEADPYQPSTPDNIVQNITKQEFESKGKDLLFKTLQEVHLKYDISQKRLSIFNWRALGTDRQWHFALQEVDKTTKESTFYFLSIAPDGVLRFSSLTRDLFTEPFHREMAEVFSKSKLVEGVVLDENGNINAIERTGLRTFPNLAETHLLMADTKLETEQLPRRDLLAFLEDFLGHQPNNAQLHSALEYLSSRQEEWISLAEFQLFFKGKGGKKSIAPFVESFWERYGFWLKNQFKNKERTASTFASLVDLHAIREEKEALFWANKGMGSTKGEFGKSNVVRKLSAWKDGPVLFDKLLETMAVDFVRIDAPTVTPFPFKLLREYQKMDRKEEGEGVDFGEFKFG